MSEELGIAEYPRPTAVRGAVRWWLRALLAGALWESGEREEKKIEEKVKEKARELMGSTKESSKVAIRLDYVKRPKIVDICRNSPLSNVPRLNLLLLARSKLSCYQPGWSIGLRLLATNQISEKAKRVILWSAALYSIFGGVGAITRRGFGALKIEKIEGESDIADLITRIYQDPSDERLRDIIERALKDARDFLEISKSNGSNKLPPCPLLSTDLNIFRFKFLNIFVSPPLHAIRGAPGLLRGSEEMESAIEEMESAIVLSRIGQSTLKVMWKRADGKKPSVPGRQYDTWLLGLPRAVKGTGYFEVKREEAKEGRRASAISMKPFKRGEGGKWTLLMYGFLSQDWPPLLEIRPSKIEISVDDTRKKSAFQNAWGKIEALVKRI